MTEFSPSTLKAKADFDKKDGRFKVFLMAFYIYTAIVMTVGASYSVVVSQQIRTNQKINTAASADRFARYTAEGARQEQITQQYIRCVATTLVIPIDQRDPKAFDTCSKTAQAQNLEGKPSTTPAP